jgi:hypothetical protein
MKTILIVCMAALFVRAAEAPKPNHEHWEVYFQDMVVANEAKAQYDSAQKKVAADVQVLAADCGPDFAPGIDKDTGRGGCIPSAPK